jgi:hypothetical protein
VATVTQPTLFDKHPTYKMDDRLKAAIAKADSLTPYTTAWVYALRDVNGICNEIDAKAWNAKHPPTD